MPRNKLQTDGVNRSPKTCDGSRRKPAAVMPIENRKNRKASHA
jgi:hypothetical protein